MGWPFRIVLDVCETLRRFNSTGASDTCLTLTEHNEYHPSDFNFEETSFQFQKTALKYLS